MNVLVSGATGYLGAETVRCLLMRGDSHVLAMGRSSERLDALRESIDTGADRLATWATELADGIVLPEQVDAVIHTAAARPASGMDLEAMTQANVLGTKVLAVAAAAAGCRRFVYASTQAVYGVTGAPWNEDAALAPATAYASTKLAGERALGMLSDAFEIAIVRLSRLYGITSEVRWEELPAHFAQLVVQGEPLPIHGSGSQRLDLLHVRDAARGLVDAATKPLSERVLVINMGGGGNVNLLDFAQCYRRLAAELGLPPVRVVHQPEHGVGDVDHLELVIDRARKDLGWSPDVSLSEGVAGYLEAASRRRSL